MINIINGDEADLRYGVTSKRTLAVEVIPARAGNSPLVFCKYDGDKIKDMWVLARSLVPNYKANYSITFSKWLLHWARKVIYQGRLVNCLGLRQCKNK